MIKKIEKYYNNIIYKIFYENPILFFSLSNNKRNDKKKISFTSQIEYSKIIDGQWETSSFSKKRKISYMILFISLIILGLPWISWKH